MSAPARAADRLLELALTGFAAWTLIYHVCTVAGIGSHIALAVWVLALAACALFVLRGHKAPADDPPAAVPPAGARVRPPSRARLDRIILANVAGAVAAGVLFAFTDAPWVLIWALWVASAACGLACTRLRARLEAPAARADTAVPPSPRRDWGEAAVVLAWGIGLAVFSLFILTTDKDDTYYIHLSAWVQAHHEFPTRDVLFSNQVFPAIYYPPINSWEGFLGTLADVTTLRVPTVVYLLATPVATFLGVLALWRLLRAWRVPMTAVAISVAMVFLCFDAAGGQNLGAFFIGRLWQGKVVFLVVMVPLLAALLHEYAARPSRRGLALLALGGIAAAGLTTSAIFVVPVIAIGYLAPVALRSPRVAALGAVALAAYPAGAGLVTRALGGRTPDVYTDAEVVPQDLVHRVLALDTLALVGVLAVLVGPVLIPRVRAAQMVAGTSLFVGLLFTPGVPRVIFHATGLGRVLWRLTWPLPTAALVGVLAVCLVPRAWPSVMRLAPAVAVCVAVILAGTAIWARPGDSVVKSYPVYKRKTDQSTDARQLLKLAHPGDVILAPYELSKTIGVFSGEVTTVDPADFYVHALHNEASAHVPSRILLGRTLPHMSVHQFASGAPGFRAALRTVAPDLVCAYQQSRRVLAVVASEGYRPAGLTDRFICLKPPNGR